MRRLRVGFNARTLSSASMRGWTRYTVNLVERLRELPVDLTLYGREPPNPELVDRLAAANVRFVASALQPYVAWEQGWLAARAARDRLDVLHCPVHFGLPLVSGCRRVLTLHDALTVEDRRLQALVPWLHHRAARGAAHSVLTVSEYSKAQLCAKFDLEPARIDVVAEAAEDVFHAAPPAAALAAARARFGLARPFLLYVGGWEGRKNVELLVRAFARLDAPGAELVLAGGGEDERARLAATFPHVRGLRLFGKVTDTELACLYRLARGFVYPSLLEGFGLQVVEAYAAGCPVIGSGTTSLGEVIGLPEATFDPAREADCAAALAKLLTDDAYHARLAAHARRSAGRYSWRRVAEATFDVYLRTLGRRGGDFGSDVCV